MYQVCTNRVCRVCMLSALILQINHWLSWEQPVVDKFADLMQTCCRVMQNECRHYAHYHMLRIHRVSNDIFPYCALVLQDLRGFIKSYQWWVASRRFNG
jgi:hypothetical protein